jgi:hypothetical protein
MEPGDQIDGDRLYAWIRRTYYGDQDANAGAQVEEGARALVAAGILPPDSLVRQIEPTDAAIQNALPAGPMIQGHWVDASWSTPVSQTGLIAGDIGPREGGHCTALLGQWYYADHEAWMPGGNSWGDAWGRNGTFVLPWRRWLTTLIDLWQVVVDRDSMGTWDGWREWVTNGRG